MEEAGQAAEQNLEIGITVPVHVALDCQSI
jgi:hypothetical protein